MKAPFKPNTSKDDETRCFIFNKVRSWMNRKSQGPKEVEIEIASETFLNGEPWHPVYPTVTVLVNQHIGKTYCFTQPTV